MKIFSRLIGLAAAVTLVAAAPFAPSHGASASPAPAAKATTIDLTDPHKKEIAMELVSSAENSTLSWKEQYGYIEDIGDGRGYTAGIIGFCSGTGDMLDLVNYYTRQKPTNVLARYLPALRKANGSDSHAGLSGFTSAWKTAAKDKVFQAAQDEERDRVYFNPAVKQARADGISNALGEFIYYDAAVMHGPDGMMTIRSRAIKKARTPAQGGSMTTYLNKYLDERVVEMKKEEAHSDVCRVETEQRPFLKSGNLSLDPQLTWNTYGDSYSIKKLP